MKRPLFIALAIAMSCGALGLAHESNPLPIPFEQDGKWGYRSGGRVVIAPQYEVAWEFSREGLAAVVDAAGWAYIDRSGRLLVRPFEFDNGPDDFHEGLARCVEDGKIGFFERHGRIVIPPRFSFALPFSHGRAKVCDGCVKVKEGEHSYYAGGRWFSIDRQGKRIEAP
jgi:WG repeat protein